MAEENDNKVDVSSILSRESEDMHKGDRGLKKSAAKPKAAKPKPAPKKAKVCGDGIVFGG